MTIDEKEDRLIYVEPVENDKNVFIYWEGPEYSLISLLRKIIYKFSDDGKNYKVHFLNDSNISQYIDIPEEYFNLSVVQKADLVRVNVVYKYGGIWLDSDTLVMSNLASLFDIIDNQSGFLIKEDNLYVCNGVFGSKSKTQFLSECVKRIADTIKTQTPEQLSWSALGPSMVNDIHLSTNMTSDYKVFNGLDTLYPIECGKCGYHFLNKKRDEYKTVEREYQPLIVLVHPVYIGLENKTEEEILEMDNILTYFLQKCITSKEINGII
tara:strand:- start:34 stop:834 length:801 start_codon:yes stop_codon:yes gene_type:complete